MLLASNEPAQVEESKKQQDIVKEKEKDLFNAINKDLKQKIEQLKIDLAKKTCKKPNNLPETEAVNTTF